MSGLDPRTIERLAQLIVDPRGPFERTGRTLERLLRDAGWHDVPAYDGSPKIPWLTDAIEERPPDSSEVERLICRVCHPVEYDDGTPSSEAVRAEVNRILEPERLCVDLVDGQPVLSELGRPGSPPEAGAPPNLEPRLRNIISDVSMREILLGRIREVQTCQEHGAHLLALVGIGSFVEGLLLTVLQEHDPKIRDRGFTDGNGKQLEPRRIGLAILIGTAHANGWIELDAKQFVEKVNDYRNFVHPRQQAQSRFTPNADTLMLCWAPIRAILNDLEISIGAAKTPA
jgi:hypothetical protein